MNSKFLLKYAQACVTAEQAEEIKDDYKMAYNVYRELQTALLANPDQVAFTGLLSVYARPKVQELVKSLAEHDDFIFTVEVSHSCARFGLSLPDRGDASKGFIKFSEYERERLVRCDLRK